MLYWALRWHEGRQVSDVALCDLLWGEFGSKPRHPSASLRELMAYVQQRHGDKWDFQDCDGKGFRILPWREAAAANADCGRKQRCADAGMANSAKNLGRPANDNCAL